MELHVHSPLAGCPSLDPASLALVWLAEMSDLQLAIYPSNNTNLSPTNALPVLISPTAEPVTGFPEIAVVLLGRELTAVETALMASCQSLAVITQWNLFVIQENYEGLTRPEISAAIPFPMQYNVALVLQREASANQPIREKGRSRVPESISKLHASILEQNKEKECARETPKETLRRIVMLTDTFNTITPFLSQLDKDSPATLLIAANLVLLSLPRLPSKPLNSTIEHHEPLRKLRDYGRSLNFQLAKYTPKVPTNRAYTLWNTTKGYAQFLRGTWRPL